MNNKLRYHFDGQLDVLNYLDIKTLVMHKFFLNGNSVNVPSKTLRKRDYKEEEMAFRELENHSNEFKIQL